MDRRVCKTLFAGIMLLLLLVFLASSLRSSRASGIIDTHEHIQSLRQAEALLAANKTAGIQKTILLPTPIETLTLNGSKSFTEYKENTAEIFRISENYPDQFIPFCTVTPLDPNAAEYLAECLKNGGKGLKLYNGHSYYYDVFKLPLDSPRMMPIYAYAEKNRIPVLYHINITNYGKELENIMKAYPNLIISVPHYMISSTDLLAVGKLLDRYPNMFTDISFGSPEYMAAGFRRISNDPAKFVKFFNKYQERILFGTDMVLTDNRAKDQLYMEQILQCYKDLLTERRFTCNAVASFYEQALNTNKESLEGCEPKEGSYCESLKKKTTVSQQRLDEVTTLNGLGLSDEILGKIYWENAKRFTEPS